MEEFPFLKIIPLEGLIVGTDEQDIDKEGYKKNNEKIFNITTTQGSLKSAVANAARREHKCGKDDAPSSCDPCTKVHHLILELKPFISELF